MLVGEFHHIVQSPIVLVGEMKATTIMTELLLMIIPVLQWLLDHILPGTTHSF